MYEFTMGGAWFRWSALDRTSKRLAAASMIAALVAAVPIGIYGGEIGYALGHSLGSGLAGHPGAQPGRHDDVLLAAQPWMAWVSIIGGIVSALLWWRFSLRQDEMFNRVQNWSFGMAGGWTMAATYLWLGLWAAGVTAAPSVIALGLGFYAALTLFWFVAVKRWA